MPQKGIIAGQHISPELLRRAKELRQEMTLSETRLWHRLRAGKMEGYHFRRQQIIAGYIVDFYCHKAALVVEVDGEIRQAQKAYDTERDEHLKSLYLEVVRFTNRDIQRNLEGVLSLIQKACRRSINE